MSSQALSQHRELSLPFIRGGFQGIDLSLFFIVPLVELSRPVFVQMLFIHQAETDCIEENTASYTCSACEGHSGCRFRTPDSFLPSYLRFHETSNTPYTFMFMFIKIRKAGHHAYLSAPHFSTSDVFRIFLLRIKKIGSGVQVDMAFSLPFTASGFAMTNNAKIVGNES